MTYPILTLQFDPAKYFAAFAEDLSCDQEPGLSLEIFSAIPVTHLTRENVCVLDVAIGGEDGYHLYPQQEIKNDVAHVVQSRWLWSGSGFAVPYGCQYGLFTPVPERLGTFERIVWCEDQGARKQRLAFSQAGNEVTLLSLPLDPRGKGWAAHFRLEKTLAPKVGS